MTTYNRLARPVGVIGGRAAYIHLCQHCGLDPNGSNNDVFVHIHDFRTAEGGPFSRVLEIDGARDLRDYLLVISIAKSNIVNDSTAQKSRQIVSDWSQ